MAAAPSIATAATRTLVSPHFGAGWTLSTNSDNGITEFVSGPATPPVGVGSLHLATGDATAGGDGIAQASRSFKQGVLPLAGISALTYSTYMHTNNGQQFPYIVLAVDADSRDHVTRVDDHLIFEAPYQTPLAGNHLLPDQGPTAMDTWQTWDAGAGGWWSYSGTFGTVPDAPGYDNGDGSAPTVQPLTNFIDAHPYASVLDMSVRVGDASPTDVFDGNVDNFTLNGTQYVFDPTQNFCASAPLFSSVATGTGGVGYSSTITLPKSAATGSTGSDVCVLFADLAGNDVSFPANGAWSSGKTPIPLATPTVINGSSKGTTATFNDNGWSGVVPVGEYVFSVHFSDLVLGKSSTASFATKLTYIKDGVTRSVNITFKFV